jgi:agmatinase
MVGSLTPTSPFLDLPAEYSAFESAAVCILPVPYDATTSFRPGARFGPAALIAASHQVELFDEELERETFRVGIHTAPPVLPNVAGPEAMVAAIAQACHALLEKSKFVVTLGGEHTVTLGAVAALRRQQPDRALGVVQFDAHRDLRATYEGSEWSHACVAARMVDWGMPLAQLGVRAWCREELDKANSSGVRARTARELSGLPATEAIDSLLDGMPEDIYVTFDLDAFDPSIMPSTGTAEPGGLLWYPTLALLEALANRRRIVGFDVVELAPQPGWPAPDLLAARLVYRLLGYITKDWHTAL